MSENLRGGFFSTHTVDWTTNKNLKTLNIDLWRFTGGFKT